MAELLAEMREMRAELRRQAAPVAKLLTVGELYALYKAAKRGMRSWFKVEPRILPLVEKYGDRQVASLTPGDAALYRLERRRTRIYPDKDRCYKELTINFDVQWFKAMLIWAVEETHIPSNPWMKVRAVKTKKTRKTSPTEDEIMRLIAESTTLMRAFILLAADSGMRRDEIRLMRWEWLDDASRVINLPAAATKSQQDRTVPVTMRTLEALRLLPRHVRSPFPFVNAETERPYDAVTIHKWFGRIVIAADVRGAPGDGRVRIHDLRHSYARRAARSNVRIEVISLILGHSTLEQTKVYLQTGEDDIADALDSFEDGIVRGIERKPAKHAGKSVGDGALSTHRDFVKLNT